MDHGELQTCSTNLHIIIWWCPPWCHTVVWQHRAFFVSRQQSAESDFPSITKVHYMFYSWRADLLIHCLRNNVNTVIESQLISRANGTEQQTQECWIQQLAVLSMVYYLSWGGGGGGGEWKWCVIKWGNSKFYSLQRGGSWCRLFDIEGGLKF